MKSKDLLDAIGQLPQDLLEEGLPTRVGMPAEEESEAGEREMKMTKQPEQKRRIRLRMGAAVAAVCVLANAGLIYGMVRMNHKTTAPTVQTSLAEELSEQKTELPSYVTDMQAFYEKQSGVPCKVDFTGMGKALDDSFELENGAYTIHLTGVVSDGFEMYTMFDIIPRDASEPMDAFDVYITEENTTDSGLPTQGIEVLISTEQREDGAENCHLLIVHHLTEPPLGDYQLDSEKRLCIRRIHYSDSDASGESQEISNEISFGPTAKSAPITLDFVTEPKVLELHDTNLSSGGKQVESGVITPLGIYMYTEVLPDYMLSGDARIPDYELKEGNEMLVLPDGSSKTLTWIEGWRLVLINHKAFIRMTFAEPLGGDTPAGSVLRINESEIPVGDLSRYFQQKPQEVQVADDNTQTKGYVEKMRKLYNTGYDFTGMGTDLDITWEDHGYKVHLTAAAGDAFRLYYFYDVYPLEGQEYDKDGKRDEYFPIPVFGFYDENGEDQRITKKALCRIGENPLRLSTSNADGQEVWHMFGRVTDMTGIGMHDSKIYTCLSAQLCAAEQKAIFTPAYTVDTRSVPEAVEIPNFIKAPEYHYLSDNALTPYTRYAVTELGIMLLTEDADKIDVNNNQLDFELPGEQWHCEAIPFGSAEGTPIAWMNGDFSWMSEPVYTSSMNKGGGTAVSIAVSFHFAKPLDIRPEKNEYLKLNGVPLAVSNPLPDFVAGTTATVVTGDTTTETTAATTAAPVGGILLTAKNVTPYGCDIVFRNTGSQDAYYIEAFRIRTTDGNPLKEGNFAFIEPAYELPAGGTATKHYDWTNYYGKLEAGEYLFETDIAGQAYRAKLTVKSSAAEEKGKLELRAENVTPTSCDIVFTNRSAKTYLYGVSYSVLTANHEQLEGEGSVAFLAIAYGLPAGESRTQHYDWSDYYGTLKAGEYLFETTIEGVTYDVCLTVK